MDENMKIDLTNKSFTEFLNFTLDKIVEDRTIALENYELLNTGLHGTNALEVGSIEHMLALHDLSESIERFIKNSSESSDKLIKLAKLQFDMLKHMKERGMNEEMTDDETADIRSMIKDFMDGGPDAK
jgi:hypothetical protein